MIVIVDYGMGNLGSVHNMLRKVGAAAVCSSDVQVIRKANKLVLPGVGAFDNGMKNLEDRGLIPILNEKVIKQKIPILGICLGMQLFTRRSEEGQLPGLGWIDADTIRFRLPEEGGDLKIPHMGWSEVRMKRDHVLLRGMDLAPRFYFVHSFYLSCRNQEDVIATAFHGLEFAAAVCRNNIMGTQFHPEKSHKYGLSLLANFAVISAP